MYSRFMYVMAKGKSPSFLKLVTFHYVYIFKIHSSVNKHLGCFHVLSIMKNATINVGTQISLQDPDFISSGYMPMSGTAGSYGISTFNFKRNYHNTFHSRCTNLHLKTVYNVSNFSTYPCQHLLFSIKKNDDPKRCEVVSHCSIFLIAMLCIFPYAYRPLVCLLFNSFSIF